MKESFFELEKLTAEELAMMLQTPGSVIGTSRFELEPAVLDDPSGNEIHLRGGTGEIEIFASVEDGRAGRADMNLLCAALIQEFRSFPKLCSPYNGIVNEQQTFSVNQFMDRKKLHLGNQIPFALNGGHKGSGPCGCILDKRPCKGNS